MNAASITGTDIASLLEHATLTGRPDVVLAGVTSDSRRVRPGFLYAAICGAHVDGHEFIDDAKTRGASCFLVEKRVAGLDDSVCVIQVEDVRRALGLVSAGYYGEPTEHLHVVGVTGTNGKTTTSHLIRAVFAGAGQQPGVIGTVSYELGGREIPATRTTPEAPELQDLFSQMVRAGCQSAVLEVSSHGLIQGRVIGTRFDTAVFTNLSHEHLDYHHTMDEYFSAKSKLFQDADLIRDGETFVINGDDEWGVRLLDSDLPCASISYGFGVGCQVKAVDVDLSVQGSSFTAVTPWGEEQVRTPLLGRYNIYNLLAAIAVGGVADIPLEDIVKTLVAVTHIPGRLERVAHRKKFGVFVDYAHTPDALEQVLLTLKEVAPERVILVFGCGGDRDVRKRPEMGRVAAQYADLVVVTSDNPRNEDPATICEQILAGVESPETIQVQLDREKAIASALGEASSGDIVLIAGKGHETFQMCANRNVPFDDREVAARYLS